MKNRVNQMHTNGHREETELDFESYPIHKVALSALAVTLVLFAPQSSAAESQVRPLEVKTLRSWFCHSLIKPFNFPQAAQQFPFEHLGDIRETKSPVGTDGTSIEETATGEVYTVTYAYQYNDSNVSSHYGFRLSVDSKITDPNTDPSTFAAKWLASIGKIQYANTNYEVVVAPGIYPGLPPRVSFSYWSTGRMIADWFGDDDLEALEAFCKAKKF